MFKKKEKKVKEKKVKEHKGSARENKQPVMEQNETGQEYKLRKTTGLKVLRFLFWFLLLLIAARGVISVVKPDKTEELVNQMKSVETGLFTEIKVFNEVKGFTENFVRQWATYAKDGETDFKRRISPYVVKEVRELPEIYDFKSMSTVQYVNAYRIENVADGHVNVYVEVKADTVQYSEEEIMDDKGKSEKMVKEVQGTGEYVLKVPVRITDSGSYAVDGLPLIVSDSAFYNANGMKSGVIELEEIQDIKSIEEALTNFLTAYYTEKQSVIDYYLEPEADKSGFCSLSSGDFVFQKIEDIKAYKKENDTLCVLTYKVQDEKTQSTILQKCYITVSMKDGRVYIKKMDTKNQ